jgi:ring-1,2-phenylacetyl-CoA epoxidase subunit PaaE
MNIKRFTGKIVRVTDISKTAKEVELELSEPLDFLAGSFVNVFMDINGERVRRAYSISSSPREHDRITLTLRLSPKGTMTPVFWEKDMTGETLDLMGPLGLNTADKLKRKKIYLFAFGVGAGVVKSLAEHFTDPEDLRNLTIVTGSRHDSEVLYKDYFDSLASGPAKASVMHVISKGEEGSSLPKGYIQDHIGGFDFNNSDVYVCGQEAACLGLVEKVKATTPVDCEFFIEGFH